jgi:hypothetical protein
MKIKAALIPSFFLLVMALSACGQSSGSSEDPFSGMTLATISGDGSGGGQTNFPMATPTKVPEGTFFSEDFTTDDGLWQLQDDDYGKAAFENGFFVLEARQKNQTMWSQYYQSFEDVKIDVDAKATNTTVNENNGFGVDCRVQENGDGYSFHISSDGYYSIIKFENTDGTRLVDWTQSDYVYPGDFTNHITAICQGSHLEMWVNGVLLTSIEDSTFTSGTISLSATTYTDDYADVSFDNLIVSKPD